MVVLDGPGSYVMFARWYSFSAQLLKLALEEFAQGGSNGSGESGRGPALL